MAGNLEFPAGSLVSQAQNQAFVAGIRLLSGILEYQAPQILVSASVEPFSGVLVREKVPLEEQEQQCPRPLEDPIECGRWQCEYSSMLRSWNPDAPSNLLVTPEGR